MQANRKYISPAEKAKEWGISERQVQSLCRAGKIQGAYQIGRAWIIPANAPRPKDGRRKKTDVPAPPPDIEPDVEPGVEVIVHDEPGEDQTAETTDQKHSQTDAGTDDKIPDTPAGIPVPNPAPEQNNQDLQDSADDEPAPETANPLYGWRKQ